jgi:chromosome segregation ATPase
MSEREKELEERISRLVVHLRALALQLARAEAFIDDLQQALNKSPTIDRATFKKIEADSMSINSNHRAIQAAEEKISFVLQGYSSKTPGVSDRY